MLDDRFAELESRLMEVEIRSEERLADLQKLERFVAGYESRIRSLEANLQSMQALLEEPADEMPAPLEDLPPHY